MSLLVFGRSGQLATELRRSTPEAVFLGRGEADLADPDACERLVRASDAQAVINAAAWTAVDAAERDEASAWVVNAAAPSAMARACAATGKAFLHVSSDYVFDGSGDAPREPDDPTGPLGAYGRTKRAGEQGVWAAGGVHAILRTSWVFSSQGSNFVKTMLRLASARDSIDVVADQVGAPTPAAAVASALIRMAKALCSSPGLGGVYHFAGTPDVSWAAFAREIFRQAGLAVRVRDVASSEFPTAAERPRNSRLDCSTLRDRFGIDRPDWRPALGEVLAELAAKAP